MQRAIFVVEDHPVARSAYVSLIEREPDLMVCGEAGNALEALEKLETCRADLVLMDISLGESLNGIELLKRVRSLRPKIPVLIVSAYDELLYAERALRAGAQGYVMKREATTDVILAVREIFKGNLYLSDRMRSHVLARLAEGPPSSERVAIGLLTDRELEAFEHMGNGMPAREISEAMLISPKTVETYKGRIKKKLGFDTTRALYKGAAEWIRHRQRV